MGFNSIASVTFIYNSLLHLDPLLSHLPPLPEGEGMFFLYCCNWYLCPYITQHHKITEIVVFNVYTQLLSGTAVAGGKSAEPESGVFGANQCHHILN